MNILCIQVLEQHLNFDMLINNWEGRLGSWIFFFPTNKILDMTQLHHITQPLSLNSTHLSHSYDQKPNVLRCQWLAAKIWWNPFLKKCKLGLSSSIVTCKVHTSSSFGWLLVSNISPKWICGKCAHCWREKFESSLTRKRFRLIKMPTKGFWISYTYSPLTFFAAVLNASLWLISGLLALILWISSLQAITIKMSDPWLLAPMKDDKEMLKTDSRLQFHYFMNWL